MKKQVNKRFTMFGLTMELGCTPDEFDPVRYVDLLIVKVYGIKLKYPIVLLQFDRKKDTGNLLTNDDIYGKINVDKTSNTATVTSSLTESKRTITIIKEKDVTSIIIRTDSFIDRYIIQHRREAEEIIINNFAMIGNSYSEHTQEITKIEYGWVGVRSRSNALFETIQI